MANLDGEQKGVVDEGDAVVDELEVPRGSVSVERRLSESALATVRDGVRNALQQGADGAYAVELHNRGCMDRFDEDLRCD